MLPSDVLEGKRLFLRWKRDLEFFDDRNWKNFLWFNFKLQWLFLDNMKSKVIHLLRQKDKGIRGALISYQDDNDLIALRNRIIHKVLSPSGSREDRHGVATSSSATTAGF